MAYYDKKEPNKNIVKFFKNISPSSVGWILDLGSGTGRDVAFLQNRGFKVVGIDKDKTKYRNGKILYHLKSAKKLFGNINILKADARHLPFKDNIFDIVIANTSFHYLGNYLDEVLSDLDSISKNGHYTLIGCEYSINTIDPFIAKFIKEGQSIPFENIKSKLCKNFVKFKVESIDHREDGMVFVYFICQK